MVQLRALFSAAAGMALVASCSSNGGLPGQGAPGITSGAGTTSSSGSTTGGGDTGDAPPGTSAGPGGGPTSGTSGTSGDDPGATTSTTDLKFDVGDPTDVAATTGEEEGCMKIDFLFVIDNSGSMADEQAALAASFPGFIASIQDTVMAQDYHIMVVDTDGGMSDGCPVTCLTSPDCNGTPCNALPAPTDCDTRLGAGVIKDPGGMVCGVMGGNRYMVTGQLQLENVFSCTAQVGTGGSGTERPMESMVAAVTEEVPPLGCNAGFLRDDAILVVTFITDEEDDGKSLGDPVSWKQALVTAKNGNEDAIVMLGLIGDPDLPNPVCMGSDADPSPTLRAFAESFNFGSWGSICSLDYAPFFDQAVMVIDNACDGFEPPG